MESLTIPVATYWSLEAQAALRNITVEELVLLRLATPATPVPEPTVPLTGEAWQAVFDAMRRDAEKRADRYPPGFVLDDSRDTIYNERMDAIMGIFPDETDDEASAI